jgi:hypothetical protein
MTVASEGCPPCWRAYNASGIIRIIQPRILMKIMGQIIDECMMAILCSKKKIKIKVPRMRHTMRRSLHYISVTRKALYREGKNESALLHTRFPLSYISFQYYHNRLPSLYTSVSIIHATRSNKLHSR